jgi:hypothetical protein
LPTIFSHHSPEARRYQLEQQEDGWRMTQTATLLQDDLDLEENQADPDKRIALSGETDSQRGRSSGSHLKLDVTYDGSYDNETGQTCFKPPLYLECGPLLRFTGIYNRAGRDIWRGSIMILTCDSKSPTGCRQHSCYSSYWSIYFLLLPRFKPVPQAINDLRLNVWTQSPTKSRFPERASRCM